MSTQNNHLHIILHARILYTYLASVHDSLIEFCFEEATEIHQNALIYIRS